MCELYGINSAAPVRANECLRVFYRDSVEHPHGWGLAWREGDAAFLHKEPVRAIDSPALSRLLAEPICSAHLLAHIRYATMGTMSCENSHPFLRDDLFGRQWVIAHNGTILDARLIDGYGALAAGDTDSEQVVIFLVDRLDELAQRTGAPLTFGERFVALSHAVEELSRANKLNLIIDDGEYSYVHTNTLNHTLFVRIEGDAAHFCTRPIEDGLGWEPLPQNRLIAYRDGRMVRMGARHGFSIDEEAYLRGVAGMPQALCDQQP